MRYLTIFSAFLFLFLSSCTSVEKLVDNGKYEETIRRASKRLTGKQKKNPKYVRALERAVNLSLQRDLATANRLEGSSNPDWERIHGIYDDIDRRQTALRPLLPLVDKNGRQANFRFVDVDNDLAETSDNAAEQLYNEAVDLLYLARSGDHEAGRKAYRRLSDLERYNSNYRNAQSLRGEARELGKVYVYVAMINESGAILPAGFERELLRLNTRKMDSEWRFYDLSVRPDVEYDYDAQIVIRDIQISPERISERLYTDEKRIVDGVEPVRDGNGVIVTDSLGNQQTRPRWINVRADVVEVFQEKTAQVSGSLVLYDNDTGRVVDDESLTAEATFNNFTTTYRGDRRALSSDTRRNLKNRARRFPSNEELVLDAAEALKPRLRNRLLKSNQTR